MKVNANTLRAGHVMEENGKLWVILKATILTPGKGAAVVQVDMRDVRTGVKSSQRYRTQEAVERVRLDEHEMSFLFSEGDAYTFMDKESFEQMSIPGDIIGDQKIFLQDGMEVVVQTYEGAPLSVEMPPKVTLAITEADPVVKGQTASSSYKPAKLENGASILVPPHIEAGTRVVVDTQSGEYVERAKD